MTGERVEDTRTLKPGDLVRVEVEGRVGIPQTDRTFRVIFGPSNLQLVFAHVPGPNEVEVYRLPKPLPPEPPVGSTVLSRDYGMALRRTPEDWCSLSACTARADCPAHHETWPEVLANHGPVRLLGDPIEARHVAEPESADRSRTRRQLEAVRMGAHPLALVVRGVNRHPDTKGLTYDRYHQGGITCGGCRFRRFGSEFSWPKCVFGDGARMNRGAGTDIRAWWPACADYEAAP